MKTYRGMVIGCGTVGASWDKDPGRVAPKTHAGALKLKPRTELVALVDADPTRLAAAGKMFPKAQLFADAATALKEVKPDVVVVATPPRTHVALVQLVYKAGVKMIICEKPLAPSAKEAAALKKIAEDSSVTFVLNFQRRFFKMFDQLKMKISQGELGTVQQVTAYYDNGLYNTGAHALDTALFVLNDHVVRATGLLNEQMKSHPEGDPDIDGILETSKGVRISMQGLDKKAYGLWELHIYGTKGAVVIREHGYSFEWRTPARRQRIPVMVTTKKARLRESFVGGAHEEVVRCFEKKLKPRSGYNNGMDVLRALDALRKSATTNKTERV